MFSNVKNKFFHFLFEAEHPERLGLMRILLCSTIFYLAIFRQFNIDEYTIGSIIPRDSALAIYPEFYRPILQFFFWPDSWAWGMQLFLIILMFFNTIGLTNRFVMFLSWVILQGFINRNYSMLFGADLIGALLLFYLSFTKCSDAYSIKNMFFKKRYINIDAIKTSEISNLVSSVFFRLLQFQISIIYAYTGFEKLKGSTWWDGTALWTVMANPQFTHFDLIWLRQVPLLIVIGTFITLIFEVYFPVMVAYKKTRYLWLGLGVLFHLTIGILLALMPFSLIMISTYFLFIEEDDLKFWVKKTKFWLRQKIS